MSSATLRLTRRWSIFVGASYEVFVDDRRIGAVRNRETIEVGVAPGRHALQLRAGRFSSAAQPFQGYDGVALAFWCRGVRSLLMYVVALFWPQLGIVLRSA